jgi:hypothetical protein
MTDTTDPRYSISYANHLTRHTAQLPGGDSLSHAAARQRARSWCVFMTSNAGRGVLFTLGEWVRGADEWGAWERAGVYSGPECMGEFTVRVVTK